MSRATNTNQNSRGVPQNGEKGWRTDETRSPDKHLQGDGAVPQAGRKRLRFAQRRDQEEPAWRRTVHAAGAPEDEGREEAGHQGPRGCQPLHRREDDVQGQTGEQEGSLPAAEEPEGDGQLVRVNLDCRRKPGRSRAPPGFFLHGSGAGAGQPCFSTGTMVSSTRRFCWRPSGVSFDAIGWFSPSPTTIRRAPRTPRLVR